MKTVIYWFSGTGNSLSIAKALHEAIEDSKLIPIARAVKSVPEAGSGELSRAAERIGLVFPVYGWGPPRLVARFVRKLNAAPGAYIFAVVTYAGNKGDALMILRRMLRERGLDLAAGWGVRMPENYPPMGGAPAPEKQREINAEAAKKIAQITAGLKTEPRGLVEQSMWIWRLLSKIVYPVFRRLVPRADRWFRADEKCNGCGICAKICPVNNIEMVNGRPQWPGHCEQCFACLHWCPQEAVQYTRSKNQPRYHHPESALGDFVNQGR